MNRIAVKAFEEYRADFSDWPRTAAAFAEAANLATELDLIVAESVTGILGFVGYVAPGRPREAVFEPGWAAIRMLSVDPVARGRGIGRALSEECIGRAQRDGAPLIALHTSPSMVVALGMYRRLEFTRDREIADRHGISHVLYTRPLPINIRTT